DGADVQLVVAPRAARVLAGQVGVGADRDEVRLGAGGAVLAGRLRPGPGLLPLPLTCHRWVLPSPGRGAAPDGVRHRPSSPPRAAGAAGPGQRPRAARRTPFTSGPGTKGSPTAAPKRAIPSTARPRKNATTGLQAASDIETPIAPRNPIS